VKAGSLQAFEALLERRGKWVYLGLVGILDSPEKARDAMIFESFSAPGQLPGPMNADPRKPTC
jgi:hypothetical protein